MLTSIIIFRGHYQDDLPLAKDLMRYERTKGNKAVVRLAPVFAGDVEKCDRVLLLPAVHPNHVARITKAYADAGVLVVQYVPIEDEPAKVVIEEKPKPTPPPMPAAEVRRLSNRQLTELARVRGISFPTDEPDRAVMIAALAAKEPPP